MSCPTFNFQLSPFNLRSKHGYTLIELLITITITTILVTIGVTAYGRAAEIQAIKSDTEKIIEIITSAQKAATSGKNDCTNTFGPYLGERLTTNVGSKSIIITSTCLNGDGATRSFDLNSFTFATSNTLVFRPLNQGIDTGSTNNQKLDFTNGNKTYRIEVERSGTIKSLGKISP
ncbi:MAG: hypothetical protein Fur0011_4240 [Candidatus Microgenomates bacterium]